MKLKDYLALANLTEAAFAEQIGVSQAAVNRYCRGLRQPRRGHMQAIERATNGAVSPADFFDSAEAA